MNDAKKKSAPGVLVAVLMAANLLFDAVVVKLLWAWHVVRVFGVRPLTLVDAMAVSLLVGYMVFTSTPRQPGAVPLDYMEHTLFTAVLRAVTLALGLLFWVVALTVGRWT